MRVSFAYEGTRGISSDEEVTEKPRCSLSNPCRKCEIQMIIRGQSPGQMSREQMQNEDGCFQCKNREHKCKPLSKAKAEASRRIVKEAVEHLFYGKPIKGWNEAMENARVVLKAESSPSLHVSTERSLVSAPENTGAAITYEAPASKTIESVPVENNTLRNFETVGKQQKTMIDALMKQQVIMLEAMVAMNKEMASCVEAFQLRLGDE